MNQPHPAPETLFEPIKQVLVDYPDGTTEYDFLTALGQKISYFSGSSANSLILFQRHFLLFHCLYRLQQDYYANQAGVLQISALLIRLWPYHAGSETIRPHDPIRDYYLDMTNLESTDSTQVNDLLGKFWLALARNDSRADALALLDLADPIDDGAIRLRYRQLVMQHHPDRGGDHETLQLLNITLAKLLPK